MYSHLYTDDIPKLHELQQLVDIDGRTVRVMESVAVKWKDVAAALGFNGSRINSLEADVHHMSEDASREMFIKWLSGEHDLRGPTTWATLVQCLREARLVQIAVKIESIWFNRRRVTVRKNNKYIVQVMHDYFYRV